MRRCSPAAPPVIAEVLRQASHHPLACPPHYRRHLQPQLFKGRSTPSLSRAVYTCDICCVCRHLHTVYCVDISTILRPHWRWRRNDIIPYLFLFVKPDTRCWHVLYSCLIYSRPTLHLAWLLLNVHVKCDHKSLTFLKCFSSVLFLTAMCLCDCSFTLLSDFNEGIFLFTDDSEFAFYNLYGILFLWK